MNDFVEGENLETLVFLICLMVSFCLSLVLPLGNSIWSKLLFILEMTVILFCGILLIYSIVEWLQDRKMKKEKEDSDKKKLAEKGFTFDDDLSYSYVNTEND